jgi:hypothetical protein
MTGGWGSNPWGGGPWGGFPAPSAVPTGCPTGTFNAPVYPIPTGAILGQVPIEKFSGVPTGIAGPGLGILFFSPALSEFQSCNEIDLDYIKLTAHASDTYEKSTGDNNRTFTWGPNSPSRTNNYLYRTQPYHYSVMGTMVQTIPSGPTTIFRIP